MSTPTIISRSLFIFICLIFYDSVIRAQESQIRLIDREDNLPISGATFQYGQQSGISDQDGNITFTFLNDDTLKVSHISYGSWQWSGNRLKEIIQQKVFYCSAATQNLFPVTIIAVHPNRLPSESVDLEFQDKMAHDGAALLSRIPALSTIHKSGSYGFDPELRGFKYDQLNIVFNGAQGATAACPNRMDPPTSQMAPNMTERMEVLKGPHSLRYGTGLGGTINFVSAKYRFTDSLDVSGRLSGSYESNGEIVRNEGRIGFSRSKYHLNLLGSWSQGNDYQTGANETVAAGFKRGSIGANIGLKLSTSQTLSLTSFYNVARDADFAALPMDLRNDDTWMLNAQHEINFRDKSLKTVHTTVYASLVNHMMDNYMKDLSPRTVNATTNANTYNYGGRTEGTWRFINSTLYAGFDIKTEEADGTRTREFLMGSNKGKKFADNVWQHAIINKTGVFGEYHYYHKKYQYIFSGRMEVNSANVKDPSQEFTSVNVTPQQTQLNPGISAGVSRKVAPKAKLAVWLGHVQRSGSLTERYINYFPVGMDPYEMLGNPDLKPEINNQADVTFEWTGNNTSINTDIFVSYLQDYISSTIDTTVSPRLPMSPGVRRFSNIDNVFKTGIELSWTQALPLKMQQQLSFAYTYAQNLVSDSPLPEIAPMDIRYRLSGNYFKGRLQPEVSFRHVTEQSRIATEFGETVTPAFSLVDIQIAYKISKAWQLVAGINNLLNENYYEHLSRSVQGTGNAIYAPGRNIFGSVNIRF